MWCGVLCCGVCIVYTVCESVGVDVDGYDARGACAHTHHVCHSDVHYLATVCVAVPCVC